MKTLNILIAATMVAIVVISFTSCVTATKDPLMITRTKLSTGSNTYKYYYTVNVNMYFYSNKLYKVGDTIK